MVKMQLPFIRAVPVSERALSAAWLGLPSYCWERKEKKKKCKKGRKGLGKRGEVERKR